MPLRRVMQAGAFVGKVDSTRIPRRGIIRL